MLLVLFLAPSNKIGKNIAFKIPGTPIIIIIDIGRLHAILRVQFIHAKR